MPKTTLTQCPGLETIANSGFFAPKEEQPSSFTKLSRYLGFGKMPPMMRTIFEGGFQFDWLTFTLENHMYRIPTEVTTLRIDDDDLNLMGRVVDGTFRPSTVTPENKKVLDLNYGDTIQRVCTVLVEDGRIFHDLELLRDEYDINNTRLLNFLELMKKKHKTFDELYLKLVEHRL